MSVVPHTHWDREWYEPFQRFRLRLVGLLDEVLATMSRDPRQRFTLDGQMAAVDDYLEVRPEQADRVTALVRAGQLAVGPWQILLDEFLCSGETIVRNLETGMRRSAQLGGTMPVGYLPDMFGHCAQMPQILTAAGLTQACVWRGVPDAVRTHAFSWVAPDGTAIRTEYLPYGYGNAAELIDAPELIGARADELATRMGEWVANGHDSGPMLAMYGSDHTAPAAELPDLLAALPDTPMALRTLPEHFAAQTAAQTADPPLPMVAGELRSHARANILPGVLSARGHLKQAMSRAERAVARYAEPLAALWYARSARRFLDMAWSRLIAVSCHDSVTGCGCDETAAQVAARMAEAEQLGQAVRDLVTGALAAGVPRQAHLVVNPTPAQRSDLVVLDVEAAEDAEEVALRAADGRLVRTQTLERAPVVLADSVHPDGELPLVLGRIFGATLYGQRVVGWSVSAETSTLTFQVARHGDAPFDVAEVRAALQHAVAEAPGPWRLRILAVPRRTVAAVVDVPPLGHLAVQPSPEATGAEPVEAPVSLSDGALDNGLLRVEVAADGTLGLRTPDGVAVSGLGRVVDGGDVGDTYNYAPPASDVLVDAPRSVRVEPVREGPLVGSLRVTRSYDWPAAAEVRADARSAASEPVTVTTDIELRAGEPFARVAVTFDNRCDDHRVRLHLPLPAPAASSFAEGQFAVVERGLTAEGGCGEEPLPTFPAAGFVAAGGLGVLLDSYSEYELVDGGAELALTLLRSVGYLSRNRHAHRDQPAGPELPTPRAQCRGERTVRLALLPYAGAWHQGGLLAAAERFRHDLLAVAGTAAAATSLPVPATGPEITGAGVVLTGVRRRDGWLELRVVAEHPSPTVATIRAGTPIAEARRADLLGEPTQSLPVEHGAVELPLRAWEIATLQLRTG